MDRREFLLNTAKAAGVTLPWWGLLPLSANAQTRCFEDTCLLSLRWRTYLGFLDGSVG